MTSHSPELDQLATALAVAQGSIQPAIRDRTNPAFKSSYADLASTWDACRVALSSNGLAVSQHPGRLEDGSVTVTTMLLHRSGQHITSVCSAQPGLRRVGRDVPAPVRPCRRRGRLAGR
jgi:hypothetical protein